MKKILFMVESLDVGGTELSLLKWLRHCDRKTFEPSIISFRDGILRKALLDLNIKTTIIHKKFPFDVSFLYRLVITIRTTHPDLIQCRNGIPVISYGVLAAKILNIPAISSVHGRTHYLNHNIKTWLWFKIMRLSYKIITVTDNIKRDIVRHSGIDPDRVEVIYNGIDTATVPAPTAGRNARKKFNLDASDFILGTIGSLRPIKGHKYLLESIPDIIKSIPNVRLIIIGSGVEEENLKKLAAYLRIEDKVAFWGYKEDAGRLIGLFDIFILPSLSEGFPNVLLEAMSAKIPIIATRVGGVTEIIDDWQTGTLIEPCNAKAIAQRVIDLASKPELRQSMTENAFQKVGTHFDIHRMLASYDQIYASMNN